MNIKSLFAFASVAMALTACSNNDDSFVNRNFPQDGVIRVATNVDAPVSRSGIETDNLTSFDMDVLNEADAAYSYFVQMKKENEVWNSFVGEKAEQMLWQNNENPIKVTAAYLKDHDFSREELTDKVDLSVSANQSTADAVEANDLVGMGQTTINPANQDDPNLVDGKIKVTFVHALAKLNLKITLGTEFNEESNGTGNNPISALTVNGTKLKYTYTGSTASAALQASDNDAQDLTPAAGKYTGGSGATNAVANYECILVPQDVAANEFSVTMLINGKTYKWKSSEEVTFKEGSAYTLELIAGKEIIFAKALSASAWEKGNEDADLGTDFEPTAYTVSDYYQWNAKSHYVLGNGWEGYAWGDNDPHYDTETTAQEGGSCKDCPTYGDLLNYINAGVYWDDDTPGYGKQSYTVNGKKHHAGIWLKKKAVIESENKWTEDLTSEIHGDYKTRVTPQTATNDIRTSSKYFFLPAVGYCDRDDFHRAGTNGYYWSSTPSDDSYAYGLGLSSGEVCVDPDDRYAGNVPVVFE